jgi:hypothetical protein
MLTHSLRQIRGMASVGATRTFAAKNIDEVHRGSGAPKGTILELFWRSLCQVCNSLAALRNCDSRGPLTWRI